MRSLALRPLFLSAVVLFCIPVFVYAAPPDAGTLVSRQQQIGNKLPDTFSDEEGKPSEKKLKKTPPSEKGVKITLEKVQFSGTGEDVSVSELLPLVEDITGREVSFSELQDAVEKITDYLRQKKGFMLGRAYLPPQDLSSKILSIGIVTGRIEGNARVEIKSPSRIHSSILEGIAQRTMTEGSPVNMKKMERSLLLMNDLSGLSAKGFLEKGKKPGTTQLIIQADEGPLFAGSASADNYGDRYTGEWRGGLQGEIRDPFGFADNLSLGYTGAKDMNQGRFGYTLPLPYTDLCWDLSYSALEYKIGKELEDLEIKGTAQTFATGVRYPLLRSRKASVWAGAGFEYMILKDEANDIDTADRKLPVGNVSASGNFFDNWFGGGLSSFNVCVKSGELDLSDLEGAEERDALGPRKDGKFLRMTYSAARLQRITREISFFGTVRGQVADGNLDSSQKFILGGPTGVRAYPVGEASGDQGHAFTFETRYDVPLNFSFGAFQVVAFADCGWVELNKDPWQGAETNAEDKNRYWLSGAGAGINLTLSELYSLRFAYARRIDNNPGRSESGMDSDNQKDKDRFWLQVSMWM